MLALSLEAAAPTIVNVTVRWKDYAMGDIVVQTSAPLSSPSIRIDWGYSHDHTDIQGITWNSGQPGQAFYAAPVLRTQADRKIYVRVRIKDGVDENTTWGCSGGSITQGTLTGLTCDSGENYPYYISDALPGGDGNRFLPYPNGILPQPPTMPTYTIPTFAGVEDDDTYTVASDCSDFTDKLADAASAGASKDTQVILPPPPAVCAGPVVLPAKTDAHTTVIRSAEEANIAPPGGRIQPSHAPSMAFIRGRQCIIGNSTTNGYKLIGVHCEVPSQWPTSDIAAIAITKTERDPFLDNDQLWGITVASPLPDTIQANSVVGLEGVPDIGEYCHAGVVKVNNRISDTYFRVYCNGSGSVPTSADTTTLNRYVVAAGAQRIVAATPGACSGGNVQVTLASGSRWGMRANDVIHIAGTATGLTGLANRGWRIASASAQNACLANSTGVSGTYVANSAIYALDTGTTTPVYVSDASKIWFDRCWIDGNTFPNRTLYIAGLTGSVDSGIINSRLTGIGGWAAIDPATGVWQTYSVDLGSLTGGVELSSTHRVLLRNNALYGSGIFFFVQQTNSGDGRTSMTDLTIEGNYQEAELYRMAGGPSSNGAYYPHRHTALELKQGRRVVYRGNTIKNGWSDDVSFGNAIALTVRQTLLNTDPVAEYGTIGDVLIDSNVFIDIAGGINISFSSDSNRADTVAPHRIAITNNIARRLDWFTWRSVPSGSNFASPNVFPSGGSFVIFAPGHSMVISHNTVLDPRGPGPYIINQGDTGIPVSHAYITDNLWTDNRVGAIGGYILDGSLQVLCSGCDPATTWSTVGASTYDLNEDMATDTGHSLVAGNVFIPGSSNNENMSAQDASCYTDTSAGCNWTSAEQSAYFGTGATFFLHPYTFTGTTPSSRLAEVNLHNYSTGDWRVKAVASGHSPAAAARGATTDYQDAGSNLDKIDIASRSIKNLRMTGVGTITATVSLTSPIAGETCYVTCPACSTKRVSDSSNSRPRNLNLTSLSSGTVYTVFAVCGSEEQRLSFRTQ